MITVIILVFSILAIVTTIFAGDIREWLINAAIKWEEKLHELSPEIREKLKKMKEATGKGDDEDGDIK